MHTLREVLGELGERGVLEVGVLLVGERAQQPDREQRDPAGPVLQPVEERITDLVGLEPGPGQLLEVLARQRPEGAAVQQAVLRQAVHDLGRDAVLAELHGPGREEEQDRRAGEVTGEVAERLPGRAVGEVDVVEEHHERQLAAEVVEQRAQPGEQPARVVDRCRPSPCPAQRSEGSPRGRRNTGRTARGRSPGRARAAGARSPRSRGPATPSRRAGKPRAASPVTSSRCRPSTSVTMRVFPTPGSPRTSTVRHSPSAARVSSSSSSWTSTARPTIGTARGSTDRARTASVVSGAHTTSTVGRGGSPLSSSAPTDSNVWPPRDPARIRTTSAARICPPWAAAHRRLASTGGVPK